MWRQKLLASLLMLSILRDPIKLPLMNIGYTENNHTVNVETNHVQLLTYWIMFMEGKIEYFPISLDLWIFSATDEYRVCDRQGLTLPV